MRRCRPSREQDRQENHAYRDYLSPNSAVQDAQTKNPQGLKDPEDCTRFFTLTLSPAHEGKMVGSGRFSGFWFLLLPALPVWGRQT